MDPSARLTRRLRIALVAVSMLAALLAVGAVGVVAYWRLYLLPSGSEPFTRGPFLTRLSETSATLRWSVKDGEGVVLRAVSRDGHEVEAAGGRFRGLRPGTRYSWTASVDDTAKATGAFTTAPRTLDRPVSFAVIGDHGSGNEHQWAVGRVMAAQEPHFILTTGDNSYLAAAPQLLDRNLFRPLGRAMRAAPLWAAVGEHDLVWRNASALIDALDSPGDGLRYTVRFGPIQIVVLGLQAGPFEREWAARELARGDPALRFVVVHRPLQPENPILPLLRRTGVAAVFAGHLHRYERRVLGGVLQFTVGTSGQGPGDLEFTEASVDAEVSLLDYGHLQVTAGAGGVEYAFLDERGRVLDRTRR
jgi:hypothetical protein